MSEVGPSIPRVAWSILTSIVRVRKPTPSESGSVDHSRLEPVLSELGREAIPRLPGVDGDLAEYLALMEEVDPDGLSRQEAMAFWINVYNAAALRLAATTARAAAPSVLGVPGAFTRPVVRVAGENLSLDNIEHGKIRRFKDPRVHGGLVCGSVSCPSLPRAPFGGDVGPQLDDRMRRFLREGALRGEVGGDQVKLSPVFSWFGGDFTRPGLMPAVLPARREKVLEALIPWMDEETVRWVAHARPTVVWDRYDWRLGCTVG